jgi:nucleotide-binding universal stress UspA family protein
MFKKILLPTDGSDLSNAAIDAGIEFAKQIQAEVIAVFVASNYQYPIYIDIIPPNTPTEEEYQAAMRNLGDSYFEKAKSAALAAGIPFESMTRFNDSPAKEIAHIAQERHCDLIFIGSHGRSGVGQLLLGSTTNKVLSLCNIPVLVHRIKTH